MEDDVDYKSPATLISEINQNKAQSIIELDLTSTSDNIRVLKTLKPNLDVEFEGIHIVLNENDSQHEIIQLTKEILEQQRDEFAELRVIGVDSSENVEQLLQGCSQKDVLTSVDIDGSFKWYPGLIESVYLTCWENGPLRELYLNTTADGKINTSTLASFYHRFMTLFRENVDLKCVLSSETGELIELHQLRNIDSIRNHDPSKRFVGTKEIAVIEEIHHPLVFRQFKSELFNNPYITALFINPEYIGPLMSKLFHELLHEQYVNITIVSLTNNGTMQNYELFTKIFQVGGFPNLSHLMLRSLGYDFKSNRMISRYITKWVNLPKITEFEIDLEFFSNGRNGVDIIVFNMFFIALRLRETKLNVMISMGDAGRHMKYEETSVFLQLKRLLSIKPYIFINFVDNFDDDEEEYEMPVHMTMINAKSNKLGRGIKSTPAASEFKE